LKSPAELSNSTASFVLLLASHDMPNSKTRTLKLTPIDPDNEVEVAELTRQREVSASERPVGDGRSTAKIRERAAADAGANGLMACSCVDGVWTRCRCGAR